LTHNLSIVMLGLVPGTCAFRATKQGVAPSEFIIGPAEGRTRWRAMPGHDASVIST